MRGECIAFDLEMTGLDVKSDEIIAIAIVKFENGNIIDRYDSLVKPSIPIPSDITHLTGIDPEDVENKPPLEDILPRLKTFFGQTPVIAHYAPSDVGFMRKYGLLNSNPVIDTYELACIIMPSASSYSLGSLTADLGIPHEPHRVQSDAEATASLYWKLWEKAIQTPAAALEEIISASGGMDWGLRPVFEAALAENLQSGGASPAVTAFSADRLDADALNPTQAAPVQIERGAIDEIFDVHGRLGQAVSHYEKRRQQLDMAHEVAKALNHGGHTMIEAGTGTGKSLAYLLPAALWAAKNIQRVVVSTHTINLQEQLLKKDIPLVKQALNIELRAAVMKGRGNYLCPRRLDTLRRRKPATMDELRTLAKILVWLQSGASGDRGEITLRAGEWAVWTRLSAEDEDCAAWRCAAMMKGACPYYKARKKAEAAHIVITNHALLIADAKIENRALPEYFNLIIDEAHHLEEAITQGMSRQIDRRLVTARLTELGGINSGILGELLAAARGQLPNKTVLKLEAFIQNISEALGLMKGRVRGYFQALHDFILDIHKHNHQQTRLLPSHRDSGSFAAVQTAWKQLAVFFLEVTDAIARLVEALPRYQKYELPNLDDYRNALQAHGHFLGDLHEELERFTHSPNSNAIYAVSPGGRAELLRIHISPLHIGPMMEEYLNQRKESIILTSATLRTQGSFEHIKERLYGDNYDAVALGSPFDYKDSTLLYIPDDIPEPSRRSSYQKMLERGIVELAAALDGRVMALFTSYAQLRETSKAITPRLKLGGIMVYDQSFGGSRDALLENFKAAEKAVLMGTRSFWEGVDIPGDDLSAVVIAKLPFAVPSDPIFAARSETYANPFPQYAVPDTILRFRQGFGRLIRSRSDRGVVAIFDSRVLTKSYGSSFLESLPDCTAQHGALENLPRAASAWINRA